MFPPLVAGRRTSLRGVGSHMCSQPHPLPLPFLLLYFLCHKCELFVTLDRPCGMRKLTQL